MSLPSTIIPPGTTPTHDLARLSDTFFRATSSHARSGTAILESEKTSNNLNHEAVLRHFMDRGFSQENVHSYHHDSGETQCPGSQDPAFLYALSIALEAAQIRKITYHFQLPIGQVLDDIRQLTGLVLRLEKIEEICFHFQDIDGVLLGNRDAGIPRRPYLPLETWKRVLSDLMDATQTRGISVVSFQHGFLLHDLLPSSEIIFEGEGTICDYLAATKTPPQADYFQAVESGDIGQQIVELNQPESQLVEAILPTLKGMKLADRPSLPSDVPLRHGTFQKLKSIFNIKWTASTTPRPNKQRASKQMQSALPAYRIRQYGVLATDAQRILTSESLQLAPGSKVLQIDIAILLLRPLAGRTIDFIMHDAPRISVLSLSNQTLDPAPWKRILDSLQLPNLERFKISSSLFVDREGASFDDLLDFFNRHPTITHLTIYGMQLVEQQLASIPERIVLPRLQELSCHPWYATTIIKSHTRLISEPHSLLSPIRQVELTRERYGSWHPRYSYKGPPYATKLEEFEHALNALSLLPTSSPVTLAFGFAPAENDYEPWMRNHISKGSEDSVIGRLGNVRNVIFDCQYLGLFTQEELVNTLPAFLNLFPKVEEAGIRALGVAMKMPGDLEEVWKRKCPTLKSVNFKLLSFLHYRITPPGAGDSDVKPRGTTKTSGSLVLDNDTELTTQQITA